MTVIISGIEYVPRFKLPPAHESLGSLLKRTRQAARLSLTEATLAIGCAKSTLSEIERDRIQPSFSMAIRISQTYDLPLLMMASALEYQEQQQADIRGYQEDEL